VANSLSNSVSVVQTSTRKAIKAVQVGKDPYGITITPNGAFVYVANSSSDSVSVISTQTNRVVDTVGVGRVPLFLGISPKGAMAVHVDRIHNFVVSRADYRDGIGSIIWHRIFSSVAPRGSSFLVTPCSP